MRKNIFIGGDAYGHVGKYSGGRWEVGHEVGLWKSLWRPMKRYGVSFKEWFRIYYTRLFKSVLFLINKHLVQKKGSHLITFKNVLTRKVYSKCCKDCKMILEEPLNIGWCY